MKQAGRPVADGTYFTRSDSGGENGDRTFGRVERGVRGCLSISQ